jgi:hypothetical protein
MKSQLNFLSLIQKSSGRVITSMLSELSKLTTKGTASEQKMSLRAVPIRVNNRPFGKR